MRCQCFCAQLQCADPVASRLWQSQGQRPFSHMQGCPSAVPSGLLSPTTSGVRSCAVSFCASASPALSPGGSATLASGVSDTCAAEGEVCVGRCLRVGPLHQVRAARSHRQEGQWIESRLMAASGVPGRLENNIWALNQDGWKEESPARRHVPPQRPRA